VRFAPLQVGDAIAQRVDEVDRIDWRLPPDRLEHFIAAGVVIHEQRRTTTVARATIVAVNPSGSTARVTAHLQSRDVPRQTTSATTATFDLKLSANNEPVASDRMSVEQAAIAGIPFRSGSAAHVGQRWLTRRPVSTSLGSGEATFDHHVVAIEGQRLEIGISGRGAITGAQYHLPKLLPGTIELVGAAWYDIGTGIVTQESYAIHTTLLKTPHGEQIGFDEHLTVDATARLVRALAHGPG
jgi:hypothetical protein